MRGAPPIEQRGADVLLTVRVQPKSSRNAVRIDAGGVVHVRLTAPPVEGEANQALIEYVAGMLRRPKRAVTLRSGAKSRTKTLLVEGISSADVEAALRFETN